MRSDAKIDVNFMYRDNIQIEDRIRVRVESRISSQKIFLLERKLNS